MPTDTFLGRLGNREGVNVAKVEVFWWFDDVGLTDATTTETHRGFYIVHAVGDEPEIAEAGEFGTIYTVFEGLVHNAMKARQKSLGFDGYEIDDISAV